MKINLLVTQTDINSGECGDERKCPVALSLQRRLRMKYVGEVRITDTSIIINNYKKKLPMKAINFIHDYDIGDISIPFKFTVDLPKKFLLS